MGVTYTVASDWLDAPNHEAANRTFRANHQLRPDDWTLVKNLEDGTYNARIFNEQTANVD